MSLIPRERSTWLHVFWRANVETNFDFFIIEIVTPDGLVEEAFRFTGFSNSWSNFSYRFETKGVHTVRFVHQKDENTTTANEFVFIDNLLIGNASTRSGVFNTYLSEDFEDEIPEDWVNNWWGISTQTPQSGTQVLRSTLGPDDNDVRATIEFQFEIFEALDTELPILISSDGLVVRRYHEVPNTQIPWQAGTLHDQIMMALAFVKAYRLTDDEDWLDRAIELTENIGEYYYNYPDTGVYLPHWLINIKSPIGSIQRNQLLEIYSDNIPKALPSNTVNTPIAWLPLLWDLYDELFTLTGEFLWQSRSSKVKNGFAAINQSTLLPARRTITNGTVGASLGNTYSGLQNLWGIVDNSTQLVLACRELFKAQLAYAETTKKFGPFAHRLVADDWEFGGFLSEANSGFFQAQLGAWAARALYESNTKFDDLKDLVMGWLTWLDTQWSTIEPDFPPVRFDPGVTPFPRPDPAVQSLIGEAALWANLSGEDPGITFRLILRSLEFLQDEYEDDTGSPMYGSWSKRQPIYIEAPLKDYESRFHSHSIKFLSELLIHKSELNYPPEKEPIRTPLSAPRDESCCGSPALGCGLWGSTNDPPHKFTVPNPTRFCRMESHFTVNSEGALDWYVAETNKLWTIFEFDGVIQLPP